MSLTEDSSGREEIATYERISLNNLLLKSKGAPYEDALRRIIEVRLQQNLRVLSLRESPVDEVDSYPHSSLPPEKKPSSQEINIEDIPSTLVSHQHTGETQICQGEDFMSDIVEHGSVYGESMCSGSTSSASKDEFQRWMLKNNGLDLHHEDQCQSWLRHISRVHQGSALPIRGAESRSSSERSKCRNVNRFEGSDNSINRSSIAQMQQSKCTRVKGQSSLDDRNRGSDAGRPQPSLPLSLSGGQRSNPIDEEKIYLMNRSCPNCDQSDDCSSRSFSSSHRRRSGSECGDAVSSTTTDSASSSRSSSRGKVQELRVKQSSCRLQDGVTARPFCPLLIARRENERILSGSRATENFEKRNAQSVQNYYIRQAFASIETSSDCREGRGKGRGGGGGMPAVGQYTPSTTIPYYQRHSRSINDTSVSLRRQKHTFGNEVYKDSFMQRSLAQSSSLGGEGVPGVGQYTKAVVIPFYQRHSSRSSSSTRRHTWGSEQYDAFKRERERETDDSTDRGRTMTCSDNDRDKDIDRERDRDRDRYMYMDKDRDRDMERDRNMNMERDMDKDRKCSSSETCSSSHGSRSTTSASTSAPYTSRSMSASRGSHRNEDRDGGGTGLPQTPGERKFRTLLHMISNIGSGAPTATRDKTYR